MGKTRARTGAKVEGKSRVRTFADMKSRFLRGFAIEAHREFPRGGSRSYTKHPR